MAEARLTRTAIRARHEERRPPDPEEAAAHSEFAAALKRLREEFLTVREDKIVHEVAVMGATVTEVARAIGVSKARCGQLLARALHLLEKPVAQLVTTGTWSATHWPPEARERAAGAAARAKKNPGGTEKKKKRGPTAADLYAERVASQRSAARRFATWKVWEVLVSFPQIFDHAADADSYDLQSRLSTRDWNVEAVEGAFRYGYLHTGRGADDTTDVWLLICRLRQVPYIAVLGAAVDGRPSQVRIVPRREKSDPEDLAALAEKLNETTGCVWRIDEWGVSTLGELHHPAIAAVRMFEKDGKTMKLPDTVLCARGR